MAKRGRRVRKLRSHRDSGTSGSSSAEEFEQEYAYVLKDLRRIFALAAAMFVLLIVLNLILQ